MLVSAYFKGIKSEFSTLMETPQLQPYDPFIQTVNSQSNQEDYWIPLTAGGVRELLDTVQFKEQFDRSMSIINKEYYDSIRERRNTILDTQEYLAANTQTQINKIVQDWQSYKVTLVDKLIADNGKAFDGIAFWSSSGRPPIAASLSTVGVVNLSTGAGTTTTLVMDDFATAKATMLGFRDVNKKFFNDPNSRNFYILCPVTMEDTFHRIFDPGMNIINVAGTAISNPYAGMAKIIVYNTTSHDWILFNANSPVKPFILQNRQDPIWSSYDDNGKTPFVEFWYNARIGAGYGSPFQTYRYSIA